MPPSIRGMVHKNPIIGSYYRITNGLKWGQIFNNYLKSMSLVEHSVHIFLQIVHYWLVIRQKLPSGRFSMDSSVNIFLQNWFECNFHNPKKRKVKDRADFSSIHDLQFDFRIFAVSKIQTRSVGLVRTIFTYIRAFNREYSCFDSELIRPQSALYS